MSSGIFWPEHSTAGNLKVSVSTKEESSKESIKLSKEKWHLQYKVQKSLIFSSLIGRAVIVRRQSKSSRRSPDCPHIRFLPSAACLAAGVCAIAEVHRIG